MYLATVLLEPNRWKSGQKPLFVWQPDTGERIAAAGFDGVELWQGHWLAASEQQREWMRRSACPVRIFSHYGLPDADPGGLLFDVARAFEASLTGIKFNLRACKAEGPDGHGAVSRLADTLPGRARLLCECHADTVVETPQAAREAFDRWPERVAAIAHPFTSPNLDEWFDQLGPRIVHLHLQSRADWVWKDPVPGSPGVAEGLEILKARAFRGTASLEFIAAISLSQDPHDLLASAANVRSAWSLEAAPWDLR